jgi:hypothetical protein
MSNGGLESYKASTYTSGGYITVDPTIAPDNDAQLYFAPPIGSIAPTNGIHYSMSPNQISDPSLRVNQRDHDGNIIQTGFLYDTLINPPYSSQLLVAGGSPNQIISSINNGITWSSNPSPLTTCRAIAYSGSVWIAGGTGPSPLAFSSNGLLWTASSTALLTTCDAVATNGSLWVAGGTGSNRLLYSYDGLNWYPSASGSALLTDSCLAISWNGNRWVAGGSSTTDVLIYSDDGITWFRSVNGNTTLTSCAALAWNRSYWLAGGTGFTKGAYSYDGVTWYQRSNFIFKPDTTCSALAYNGSQWIAGSNDVSNVLIFSADGSTWTTATYDASFSSCETLLWTGNLWIAGGTGTYSFMSSVNGATWTPLGQASSLLTIGSALAQNTAVPIIVTVTPNPLILIGGTNSVLISSLDGITWLPVPSANTVFSGGTCYALNYNGTLWAGGFDAIDNTVGYSYDGLTWNVSDSGSIGLPGGCYAIGTSGPLWIAGGTGLNRVIRSSDGIVWIPDASANELFDTSSCFSVAFNGAQWIATSDSSANRLIYTTDASASTWQGSATANDAFPFFCASVAWNGQTWVAVGDSGTIVFSGDGNYWVYATDVPYTDYWNSVAYNGTMWVVGGTGGPGNTSLAYSFDGTIWIRSDTGSALFDECTAVTWTGSLWLATGANGTTSAAFSYNGTAWLPCANTAEIIMDAYSVAAARPLSRVGFDLPPPALYPFSPETRGEGQIVYSTGLNDLYVSTTFTINDLSGSLGINQYPTMSTDITGHTNMPTIDLSGQEIQISTDTSGQYPELVLTNVDSEQAESGQAGRILFQNLNTQKGWSIDTTWNPIHQNNLEFVNWNGGNSIRSIVVNDTGQVGIGIEPQYTLDVSGSLNVSDGIATNRVDATDINAATLTVNTINTPSLTIANITVTDLSANRIDVGDMSANNISVRDLQALNIDISGITLYTLSADFFDANDISANTIKVGALNAVDISANTIYTTAILAAQPDTTILPLTMGTTINPSAISINDTRTIIQTAINPSAITINDTQTIIQNADLSGIVYIGNGDLSGALQITSGAEGNASLYVNTPANGRLILGSSLTNSASVQIQDTYISLCKDIYINNTNNLTGALKISSSIEGNASITGRSASGELVLGSSLNNQNAITITDTGTTIANSLTATSFRLQNASNPQLRIGDLSANNLSVTRINFTDISANSLTAASFRLQNASNPQLRIGDLSANSLGITSLTLQNASNPQIRIGDLSANNVSVTRINFTDISANSLTAASFQLQNASNPQLRIGDLSANNLSVTRINFTDISANSLTAASFRLQNASNPQLRIGDLSANSLGITSLTLQNASNPQLRIGDLSANNLSVTRINFTDISANSLTAASFRLQNASNPQLRIGDLSANTIAGIGTIASSVTTSTRGPISLKLDLSTLSSNFDSLVNGCADWSYNWVATGNALNYKTFIVTLNAILDPNNVTGIGSINIGAGQSCLFKRFVYKATAAQYFPITYTFIVGLNEVAGNPLNTITISAAALGGGLGAYIAFPGTAGAYFLNSYTNAGVTVYYTSIDIVGLA